MQMVTLKLSSENSRRHRKLFLANLHEASRELGNIY